MFPFFCDTLYVTDRHMTIETTHVNGRIIFALLGVILVLAVAPLTGCSTDDAAEPEAPQEGHTVPAGDAAQEAVDELNEQIEDTIGSDSD